MGFFDRILKGRLFTDRGKESDQSDFVDEIDLDGQSYLAPAAGIDEQKYAAPAFVAEMDIDGQKYILTRYELGFSEDVERSGNPGGEISGGILKVTMEDVLATRLNSWVMSNVQKKRGKIRVYKNETDMSKGTRQTIIFEEAYCIGMKKESGVKGGVVTSLTISPAKLKIDDEEFKVR